MVKVGAFPKTDLAAKLLKMSAAATDQERSARLGKEIRVERENLLNRLSVASVRGGVAAEKLSALVDEAVSGVFLAGAALYPDEAQFLSVAAIGGYGRGRLAPFSDIDLLFLHNSGMERKVKPLLNFILYALWDARLKISQSVHSPDTAMKFVSEDHVGCTSFLDMRPLSNVGRAQKEFSVRFKKFRKETVLNFVSEKLKERAARLVEDRASRYMVEPDIKEGKGALRDLQTLHWLARYVYGAANLAEQVEVGLLSPEEAVRYEKARDFFWSIRMHLHNLKGRADEQLAFDVQPEIATRLGYKDRGNMLGAERLMKHYFLHAREVGRLTGIVSSLLEKEQIKSSRLAESEVFKFGTKRGVTHSIRTVRPDEVGATHGFVMKGDRLGFSSLTNLADHPLDMFRLFRIAGRKPVCEIDPDALQSVAAAARGMGRAVAKDPLIKKVFEAILLDTEEPVRLLRDMAEAGLLGRYLPAYGMLVGRVRRNLYRRYTIDEHVLKSLETLVDLRTGQARDDHPLSTKILEGKKNHLPFFLAVLMHETKKAYPAQDEGKVEAKIKASIRHFFETQDKCDTVTWAALNHRLMARTASRRNVMDANTIKQFAQGVGNLERLDILLVLTICHLRAAGINSWDKWMRRDLTVLYEASCAWFLGAEVGLARYLQNRRSALRNKTARLLSDWSVHQLDKFFGRLPPEFFEGVKPESAARFARLAGQVDRSNLPGLSGVYLLSGNLVEAVIYSRDKPGLFADIAGVVAMAGGMVRSATAFPVRAFARGPDMVANVFVFQLEDEVRREEKMNELAESFNVAIANAGPENVQVQGRLGDRRERFERPSNVTLDELTSKDCLIIETRGLDRPGLLYHLASALNEIGVSIRTAYISSFGELAVDAFYVQSFSGYKIKDKNLKDIIQSTLLTVLDGR